MQTPATLTAKYGDPRVNTAAWAKRYIVRYQLPVWLLPHFPPLYDSSKVTAIQMHRDLVQPFEAVMRELVDTGLCREWKSFDGCWCVRNMRGLNVPSIHSWGLATDFNAKQNPLGGRVTFTAAYLAVWRKRGFDCGADWKMPRTDGMHTQLR